MLSLLQVQTIIAQCIRKTTVGNQTYSRNCPAQICAAGLEKRSVFEEEQKSNNH